MQNLTCFIIGIVLVKSANVETDCRKLVKNIKIGEHSICGFNGELEELLLWVASVILLSLK